MVSISMAASSRVICLRHSIIETKLFQQLRNAHNSPWTKSWSDVLQDQVDCKDDDRSLWPEKLMTRRIFGTKGGRRPHVTRPFRHLRSLGTDWLLDKTGSTQLVRNRWTPRRTELDYFLTCSSETLAGSEDSTTLIKSDMPPSMVDLPAFWTTKEISVDDLAVHQLFSGVRLMHFLWHTVPQLLHWRASRNQICHLKITNKCDETKRTNGRTCYSTTTNKDCSRSIIGENRWNLTL